MCSWFTRGPRKMPSWEAGHGTRREDVMYNDFIIVGPAEDPAGIAGMTNAAEAMAQLASSGASFVSRGDESGTHVREKSLWSAAGIEPSGDWYISAGQGMGAVLQMAEEQQAYSLSDRATYLARKLEGLDLEILVEGDPLLLNPYGVITVNPNKGDHIHADWAEQFVDWIISVEAQELIGQFGVEEFGSPLFTPDSSPGGPLSNGTASPSQLAQPAPHSAGLVSLWGRIRGPTAGGSDRSDGIRRALALPLGRAHAGGPHDAAHPPPPRPHACPSEECARPRAHAPHKALPLSETSLLSSRAQ